MNVLTPHRKNVLLVLLGCVVLPPLTHSAMPRLLPDATAQNLCLGATMAIAALSLNLLLGYAGQLSLGHAALLGSGALAASVVIKRLSMPMFAGWIVAAAAGGLVALGIGLPALRLRGLYLALVTIVFGLTLQSSLLRWNFFGGGSGGVSLPRRLIGHRLLLSPSSFLSMILVVLVFVWLLDRNVLRTRLGRAFRAIREDEIAAQSFAIDVTRYKLLAFVISGAIAGLAGALYGNTNGLVTSDNFSLQLSLQIVLIVIIGGVGHRWGAVVVALILALGVKLPASLRGYDLVAAAAIVLYNVVRFPGGLAAFVAELTHRRPLEADIGDEQVPNLTLAAHPRPVHGDGPLLTVEGVAVSFGGLRAVDDVSLQVEPGRIVGIIGPNGAGKSTLFNAISGFAPTTAGRITLEGARIDGLLPHERARRGLGRTFQLVGLAKDQTVRENILLAQHLAADYSDAAALLFTPSAAKVEAGLTELADDVIARLGFERYADTPVRQLSGGQQRLVELAAVLATSPSLLMLDEPTAGLAPGASENLADRLHELRADHGQSILLIEHNVPLVLDLCDYVYVLAAGRLLAEGTTTELSRQPEVLSAYLGEILT